VIPRFREGEVVRVERLGEGWKSEDAWVIGQEAVIHSISNPNERGTSWLYLVWIDEPEPTGRVLWVVDQSDLTSLGLLEHDDGRRDPLPASPSPDEMHDEIYLRLVTDIRDETAARHVADAAAAALRRLVRVQTLDVEAERHWHEPFYYEVRLRLEVEGDVLAAFDRIIAEADSGWTRVDDDGWRCDGTWSQRDAESGSVLLDPQVEYAEIVASPWETVERRPAAQRSNARGDR
jgi:hypothetical protein